MLTNRQWVSMFGLIDQSPSRIFISSSTDPWFNLAFEDWSVLLALFFSFFFTINSRRPIHHLLSPMFFFVCVSSFLGTHPVMI